MFSSFFGSLLGAALLGKMLKPKAPAMPSASSVAAPAPAVKASEVTPELELNDTETMADEMRKKRKGKRKYRVDKIQSSEAAGLQGTNASSMANLKIK